MRLSREHIDFMEFILIREHAKGQFEIKLPLQFILQTAVPPAHPTLICLRVYYAISLFLCRMFPW